MILNLRARLANIISFEDANAIDQYASRKRTYGFKMSVKGAVANSIGTLVMYIIVMIAVELSKHADRNA